MKLDRVIIRTIVNTLCAISVLCAMLALTASLVFPSTMMGISYKLGNDSGAMKYAHTAYSRTGEVAYIAYATDVAFVIDADEDIVRYGEEFVADDQFLEYCEETDRAKGLASGEYYKYVYGRLSVSIYRLGDKQKAYDCAIGSLGEDFARNNALVALFVESMVKGDGETAEKIASKLTELLPALEEADGEYAVSLLAMYENFLTRK